MSDWHSLHEVFHVFQVFGAAGTSDSHPYVDGANFLDVDLATTQQIILFPKRNLCAVKPCYRHLNQAVMSTG